MSQVLYARVPDDLKTLVAQYAGQRSMSLNAATASLVEFGLTGVERSTYVSALERQVEDLSRKLAAQEAVARQAANELESLEERDRQRASASKALSARLDQVLAPCPNCGGPVRGYDLLVTGTCNQCSHGVLSMLTIQPKSLSTSSQGELAVLLSAIGLALALVYLQSRA